VLLPGTAGLVLLLKRIGINREAELRRPAEDRFLALTPERVEQIHVAAAFAGWRSVAVR
jgi:hypothetical protein